MKFTIIAALASSVYGASCLNDYVVRTYGSPGFLSAKIEQVSNAPPSFAVFTSGIVGTISTGLDNCKFYLSGLKFQINVKENKDPELYITPNLGVGLVWSQALIMAFLFKKVICQATSNQTVPDSLKYLMKLTKLNLQETERLWEVSLTPIFTSIL